MQLRKEASSPRLSKKAKKKMCILKIEELIFHLELEKSKDKFFSSP